MKGRNRHRLLRHASKRAYSRCDLRGGVALINECRKKILAVIKGAGIDAVQLSEEETYGKRARWAVQLHDGKTAYCVYSRSKHAVVTFLCKDWMPVEERAAYDTWLKELAA